MKWLLAIALAVVGLALAWGLWARWPRDVKTEPVTLFWAEPEPEITTAQLEFIVGSVSFVDATKDRHAFVMMRRGASTAVLHDLEHFLYVDVTKPHAWVLAEGRDVLTLFHRQDDGQTWDVSRITKPSEQTYVESWEVDGDTISIQCANDRKLHPDDMEQWEPLVLTLPSSLRPVEYANDIVFRTRDAGRTWRLSR